MDIKTFAIILFLFGAVTGDCLNGIQSCLKDYTRRIATDANSFEKVCGDIETVVKCAFSQGCPIDYDAKQYMIRSLQDQVSALHCPFSMDQLFDRYSNVNTASLTSSTNIYFIIAIFFYIFIETTLMIDTIVNSHLK
ncbi:hypothetical protein Btru_043114 [Bulinus truncatus]|nr:hypothetical protein Btru_043114 [Bulinus truncatus]